MLLVKYFNYSILFLIGMLPKCLMALTVHAKCGEYSYEVRILNENDIFEKKYKLYYQTKSQSKKLFYKTEPGISLNAACIKDNKKQDLMLFQESCGGNGCSEEMYSLFDPAKGKFLIKSDLLKGNSKEVQKIIGYKPPFYVEDIFFCCYKIINK